VKHPLGVIFVGELRYYVVFVGSCLCCRFEDVAAYLHEASYRWCRQIRTHGTTQTIFHHYLRS